MVRDKRVIAAIFVAAALAACSSSRSSTPPAKTAAAPAAPAMKPVVSVKELMRFTIDPAGDYVFDAVTWDISKKGIIETKPRNEEDWEKVKIGAVTLAEAIYLLKVPRPFAPAGDVNNSMGPNPPELSPIQIKAKLEKDPVLWEAKIQACDRRWT